VRTLAGYFIVARKRAASKRRNPTKQDSDVEEVVAAMMAAGVPFPGESRPSLRTPRKGRPKGSGAYSKQDKPLIAEMASLIKTGTATSIHNAAQRVAERAVGGGTFDSRVRRLERGFKKEFDNK
jgi:hypothetical protein